MQINKETIKLKRSDASIRINIGSTLNNGLGIQEQIETLTNTTSHALINPHVDREVFRFKLKQVYGIYTFKFYFGDNTNTSLINAGFSQDELNIQALNVANSFFILDFYDSYNPSIQNKLFTTYITQIGRSSEYTLGVLPVNYTQLNFNNQAYYWYVPKWFLNENSKYIVKNIYLKLSFYNAKTGKVCTFYNNANGSLKTPEKQYIKCSLDLNEKNWYIINNTNNIFVLKELVTSDEYLKRINNTFETTDVILQQFPTGNTYNYKTNSYVNLSGSTIQ